MALPPSGTEEAPREGGQLNNPGRLWRLNRPCAGQKLLPNRRTIEG